MKELKVAEWNVNSGCYGKNNDKGKKLSKLVSEYLSRQTFDMIILTEFALREDTVDYDFFEKKMGVEYELRPYFPYLYGGNKNGNVQENGVCICLKKDTFNNCKLSVAANSRTANFGGDDIYTTPDFLHIEAITDNHKKLNIIGVRIRCRKDYKERKSQLDLIQNYMKDINNYILIGDFNNGDLTRSNGPQSKYYNYKMIESVFPDMVFTPSNIDPKTGEIIGSWKSFQLDHLITDLIVSTSPEYRWDFLDNVEYNSSLPDHAILEATIKLNDTEENE
jgi:hypothetical protein